MEKRGKRKEKQREMILRKLQGFIWMRVDHKFLPRVRSSREEESLLNGRCEEC